MKKLEMSAFQKQSDELKALLTLGQRIIPLIEEMFYFIMEINPILDEINSSIADNLKSMPIASVKLSKVTEATENASNEIINLVDTISVNNMSISANLKQISDDYLMKNDKIKNLKNLILELVQNNKMNSGDSIKEAIKKIQDDDLLASDNLFDSTFEMLDKISEDSSSIMMSLQVQDITSQQIASVNHILTTIQSKLSDIWNKFNDSDFIDVNYKKEESFDNSVATEVSVLHRKVAFDMNPIDNMTNSEMLQQEVDNLLLEQSLIEFEKENLL